MTPLMTKVTSLRHAILMKNRIYAAIDLKSFFASVECQKRGLDPMNTNLVVADEGRTDKTICLAVSPSLKSYGIPGRARLYHVRERLREVNAMRKYQSADKKLHGSSYLASELKADASLQVDFLIAPPAMASYMEYSTRIYAIYMKYAAPEDIIVYSIDEVFMDITDYLAVYQIAPHDFVMRIILDVLKQTGITATAGIGTNLYLAKIAMDIMAKHIPADENGVRIAQLDEMSYRRQLWGHRPITDFWRVGTGYAKKLAAYGMLTMGDVARCSEKNEDLLYQLFGKNAELLIDHAWGIEPCQIADIKAYVPENNSLGSGQVLQCPYDYAKARIVMQEMAEGLSLELFSKGLAANQLVMTIGYDIENIQNPDRRSRYAGEIVADRYGRQIPKASHGSSNLDDYTASTSVFRQSAEKLFDRIVDRDLLIRRMNLTANHVIPEGKKPKPKPQAQQLDLFGDYQQDEQERAKKSAAEEKERRLQEAALAIKKRFGKNALLKGTNLQEGATAKERNRQIGGHRA